MISGFMLVYDTVCLYAYLPADAIECVAVNPQGTMLASVGDSWKFDVKLWDLSEGTCRATLTVPGV